MTDKVSTAPGDVVALAVVLEERMTGDFDDATGCYRDYQDPTCQKAAAALRALSAEVERLKSECAEINQVIDLQHKRSKKADDLWRAAHPGNDLAMPDLGKLLEWFIGIHSAAKETLPFLGYLLDHLPEDARDNRIWVKLRAALGE